VTEIKWGKGPFGATHYNDILPCHWLRVDGCKVHGFFAGVWVEYISNDFGKGHVDCAVYRKSKAWSGEGLPPVGIDIEFKSSGGEWLVGQYIGQFNGKIIAGCHATGVVGYLQSGEMRPIRTPEQVAADEREAAVAAWRAL